VGQHFVGSPAAHSTYDLIEFLVITRLRKLLHSLRERGLLSINHQRLFCSFSALDIMTLARLDIHNQGR
jgi:hypothetical protein